MDLLIIGASARAAAFSALRIGLRPTCVDLFADRDLAEVATTLCVAPEDYPLGLANSASTLDPRPWLYTGALENHPDLVAAISATHPLLGNPGATLTRVRDPIAVAEALKSAGLDALEVQLDPEGLPTDGSWLVKPRASAGGRGIHPWRGSPVDLARRVYYQRRVEGTSLSAQFTGLDSGSRCLGIGRQFVGKPGNPFAYRGSLVPWPVNDEVAEQVDRIGSTLAANFSLRGLFGVDFILDGHRVFPVEVNPRYTASVEAHEWASGRSFLAAHLERFGLDPPVRSIRHAEGFVAKLILHADRPLVWPAEIEVATTIDRMPEIADLPWPGTEFAVGDPIATIFASGASPTESWKRLLGRVKDWRRRLWGRT